METSSKYRFARFASAAALGLLVGAFAIGSAHADDHHGGDHGRGHKEYKEHHDRDYRGPDVVYAPQPDYYYAPAPDYYEEPDPYDYGYYPPEPGYYPPAPSEGINLFFGR